MSLENLDNNTVFESEELLAEWLNSYNDSLDTSVGTVIRELLIKPAALYYTSTDTDINTVIDNLSITDGTDDDIIEKLLSNYNVVRKEGTTASGFISIYTSVNNNLYIPNTTVFTVGSEELVISDTYIGVANEEDVLDSSRYRVLRQYDDTTWFMTIPVTTANVTSAVISQGQTVTADTTLEDVTKIETASTFEGGSGQETTEEMKARAAEGITAKVPSGKAHVEALFTNLSSPTVYDTSVIGMGDSEMLRGRNNIYGINPGGRVDIYTRTGRYPSTIDLTLTGTLIDPDAHQWKVLISKEDAPGFYLINKIEHDSVDGVKTYTGSVDYTFTCDVSGETYIPDCGDGTQSRYTKFQTAECIFTFEDLGFTTLGDTTTFTVSVLLLPAINTLQDYISDPEFRNPAGDYLIKAPIPMFISVETVIKYGDTRETPDEETIKSAIADSINNIPMKRGYVTTTELSHAILQTDSNLIVQAPMILSGFLYDPSGEQHYYRSTDTLTVEEDLDQGVSANTVAFFCDPSSVSISLIRTNEYLV
jgi:hypothetical protein